MNKYLIFVKHSLPQIEENIPAREWHLSEVGRLRAERLVTRLTIYKPEVLFSSTEPKATETAEIIANKLQLNLHVFENLHEHDRSNTPYLSHAEFQNTVREFFINPEILTFGNETAEEAYRRFSNALHSILEANRNKTITIVSHGTVISLFVSRLLGTSDYSLWKTLGLPGFVVLDMISRTLITQENIL